MNRTQLSDDLLSAATNGYAEVVELILDESEAITVVNETDKDGNSPLILAATGGHVDVVDLLLEKEADVNFLGHEKISPIRAALAGGHPEVAELLLRQPGFRIEACEWTPLNSAASQGFLRVVKGLLTQGADLDKLDDDNSTPLHLASANGHAMVVKRLLRKSKRQGVDNPSLEKRSGSGLTPLIAAATEGHSRVVQLLLDEGANLDAVGKNNETALKGAIKNGHAAVIKLLYDKMKEERSEQSQPASDDEKDLFG
ncbi:ankyrin repeat-containing domain protein [Chaetomium tenue]|uniref:Ankyrin repeat-containing domain protein n=1 Tax=Chaetomium tenue TaxID=1854479 RepID=A0ACB7PMD7_9PEZI|nr:ankyrin repeat-containing domain protein [Chaetomium globosum]